MDDFGLLARDLGFRPQGKSVSMSASKSSSFKGSGSNPPRSANPLDPFDNVFGGTPRQNNPPPYSSIFDGFKDPNQKPSSSSMPVYDKPVYDDDIFDGVSGIKSSAKVEYEDVFASVSSKGGHVEEVETYDDLLGSLGRSASSKDGAKRSEATDGFEELIPGFGRSSPPSRR